MTLLLAADIGGTKSELAVFDLADKPHNLPLARKRYLNNAFRDFDEILTDFLSNSPTPDFACLGVAAVIRQGEAKLTNLDWTLCEGKLQSRFGLREVTLINDLTALCASLPLLQGSDLLEIQQGQREEKGIQAVIAPGTGLGEGFLITGDSLFLPQGSEGGHADFAPRNQEQAALLSSLQKNYSSVSYELVCSGKGIPHLFDFFSSTDLERDDELFKQIAEATDRTPLIVEGALTDSPCPLCTKTLTSFLEILGAEAGNLALKLYATGGLFIGGGILPRLVGRTSFAPFLQQFRKKEKMEDLMEAIPVHLIVKTDAALLGTASYGWHHFAKQQGTKTG